MFSEGKGAFPKHRHRLWTRTKRSVPLGFCRLSINPESIREASGKYRERAECVRHAGVSIGSDLRAASRFPFGQRLMAGLDPSSFPSWNTTVDSSRESCRRDDEEETVLGQPGLRGFRWKNREASGEGNVSRNLLWSKRKDA